MTNPTFALALVAFSGSNNLFTPDHPSVRKNVALLCLLEIKPCVWGFMLFAVGYSVRTVLRNLLLLEDSIQLHC